MDLEKYKKACKLQSKINDLQNHLWDIKKQDVERYVNIKLVYESTKYSSVINTIARFVPPFSIFEYMEKVEKEIAELEKEFESL
jgi:hypothetical protein